MPGVLSLKNEAGIEIACVVVPDHLFEQMKVDGVIFEAIAALFDLWVEYGHLLGINLSVPYIGLNTLLSISNQPSAPTWIALLKNKEPKKRLL